MFNTRLKQELAALREDLSSLLQVKESLENEMLCLTLNAEGRVEWANANFLQELVYPLSEIVGRAIEDLVPAHVRQDEFQLRFKHALARGEHFAGTVRLLRGNGKEAWLRSIVQPVRNSQGHLKHFSMFSSDLTRTIESSREHDNLITALMRSTALIEFDLDGHVLTANDRFLSSMGYSLAQIQGKHHRMFCEPQEYNSPEYQQFWKRLNAGEYVAARFKRVDSHGRLVWLEATYNPVRGRQRATVQSGQVRHGDHRSGQPRAGGGRRRQHCLQHLPANRRQRPARHHGGDPGRGSDA
ncbi:PAS domain-containing protein [Pseudomonas synxantha]|uniref:PAS domain-containing protein n=1 Tax=Pseudomonas synxantha TaxID=47883 RepID=UPI0035218A81